MFHKARARCRVRASRCLIFIDGCGTGLPRELSLGKINSAETTCWPSLSYSYGNIRLLGATNGPSHNLSVWATLNDRCIT